MQKNIVIYDLIFYIIFPILIFNVLQDYIGDYYAMLISSIPGVIYSSIRFVMLKKVNFFGVFIITNLAIGTLIDVLSGSAIQLLWNNIYYSYFVGGFFILSVVIKKPIFLYFSLDFVEMQGQGRDKMKELFYQRKILLIFNLITLGFAFRDILLATIKIWLVSEYGVDAFDKGIVIRQLLSWTLTGISIYGFIYISKLLNSTDDQTKGESI